MKCKLLRALRSVQEVRRECRFRQHSSRRRVRSSRIWVTRAMRTTSKDRNRWWRYVLSKKRQGIFLIPKICSFDVTSYTMLQYHMSYSRDLHAFNNCTSVTKVPTLLLTDNNSQQILYPNSHRPNTRAGARQVPTHPASALSPFGRGTATPIREEIPTIPLFPHNTIEDRNEKVNM